MMLTWISLVHPLKISGLEAWQCNDCLWTAAEWLVFSLRKRPALNGHLGLNSFPELACMKQPFSILDLLTLYFTSVSSVKTNMLLRPNALSQSLQSLQPMCLLALCWSLYSLTLSKQTKKIHLLIIKSGFCCLATCDNHWGCKELKELTAVCWPLWCQELQATIKRACEVGRLSVASVVKLGWR